MGKFPVLSAALFVGFVAAFFSFYQTRDLDAWIAVLDLIFVFLAAIQFWSAAAAASLDTDKIWYRISVGLFIWCIAIVLRLFEMALKQPGYGSLADSFWVAGYFPLISGALRWFRLSNPPRSERLLILLFFLGIGAFILLVFELPLLMNPARPTLLKMLDLVYAAFDLILVGLLMAPALKKDEWGCRMVMIVVTILLASDIVFSYYGNVPSSWVYRFLDLPYTTGYFLLSMAGSIQRAKGAPVSLPGKN